MPDSAAQRARALYRRELVELRLKRFTERLDPEAVRASRDFHIKHWVSLAKAAVERDHAATYYGGLEANVERSVAEHPADDLPPELQRAVLADLAFMEGQVEAFREVMKLLSPSERGNRE